MKLVFSLLFTLALAGVAARFGWNGYLTVAFFASLGILVRQVRCEAKAR